MPEGIMKQLLSLKELRAMARTLSPSVFLQQLGPLALVERPAAETLLTGSPSRKPGEIGPTSVVHPELVMARMLLLALETEDLQVATLPPLRSEDELRVGRQPDCDLVIDDESVSKRHAVLRWHADAQRCTLEDEGSTNGTFVNTVSPIEGETELHDGDIVCFGDVAFWFLLTKTLHSRLARTATSLAPPAR
jgi:hypothetical protein